MPYLETAQSWLTQSTLLLQARPSTTRITSKYTITPPLDPSNPKRQLEKKSPLARTESAPPTTGAGHEPIRATLTLKTYDPASGATLKYRTTKAAEVSRLVQIMGRLARPMAGLPELNDDIMMDAPANTAAPEELVISRVGTPVPEAGAKQGGPAGKKGKKKGKK